MKNEIKRAINTNLACMQLTEREIQEILLQIREGKQVKKKLSFGLALLLMALLLAVTAMAVGAMSGMSFWRWEEPGSPLDMVVMEDQVFFQTEDALYQWDPSTEKTTELVDWNQMVNAGVQPVCSSLFVQDGTLKLFGEPGKLWRYEDGGWVLERDYQDTPLAAFGDRHRSLFAQDGFLFLLKHEESTMTTALYRLNMEDGSVKRMALDEVTDICSYRNGAVLAVVMDHEQQQEKLIAVDIQSGEAVKTLAVLHTLALDGLTYHARTDQIYAMADGALSRWNGAEWQIIRKAVIPGLSHSFGIAGNQYLAASHEGIQKLLLEPTEEPEQKTLTIRGYRGRAYNLDHDYQQAHPEMVVSRQLEGHLCAAEVQEAIQSGDKTDLFHLHVNADWPALLESGLLETLKSDFLMEYTDAAEQRFQQLVRKDGNVYALLSDVSVTAWSPTAEQQPQTFCELLKAGQGIAWGSLMWQKEDYVSLLLKQQIAENAVNFDTKAFRNTLTALKQSSVSEEKLSAIDASAVFSLDNLFPDRRHIAPLRIDAEKTAGYPVRVHLYVLNPNSENQEEAITFLEYVASVADAQQSALLSPYTAEESLLPFAAQWMEEIRLEYEEQDNPSTPFSEEELKRRLDEIRNIPGHKQVAEDRLLQYRNEIFPNLDLQMHPLLSSHSSAFQQMEEAVELYLTDALTLDETIAMLCKLAQTE